MAIRDNVVIGCSGYNDVRGLSKLIEQTHEHVKQFIYVDGVYDFFKLFPSEDIPNPSRYSTDGSRELCAKYDNVTLIEYAGYQPDKRQRYADEAAKMKADVLLIIDTDEWLHPDFTDWDKFYDQLEAEIELHGRFHRVWNMMIYVDQDYELALNAVNRAAWSVGSGRIWWRPEELEYYAGVHYFVRRKGTEDPFERLMSTDRTIDKGIRLITSTALRSPEFKDARNRWAKDGMDYEEKLINQYNSLVNAQSNFLRYQTTLYPLICVLTPCVNEQRETGIVKSTDYADVLFIKYDLLNSGHTKAVAEALKYFRRHAGYTHLALAPFNMNWSRKEYDMLYQTVRNKDHTVLSGYTINSYLKEPEAQFKLYKNRMNPNHIYPTADDIKGLTKLYRMDIVDVASVEELALTFIRKDIVKFIGEIEVNQPPGTDPARVLSKRLRDLGIPQYVNLNCVIEKLNLPMEEFPLIHDLNIIPELHVGKYGKT